MSIALVAIVFDVEMLFIGYALIAFNSAFNAGDSWYPCDGRYCLLVRLPTSFDVSVSDLPIRQ